MNDRHARTMKHWLRTLRMRAAARLGGARNALRWTGCANDPGASRAYLSLDEFRRERCYPGALPSWRFLLAQNFIERDFIAFAGPKLFFRSEPPQSMSRATRDWTDDPANTHVHFAYTDPDPSERMVYPAIEKLPAALLDRRAVLLGEVRPKHGCLINRWSNDPHSNLIAERVRFARAMGDRLDIYGAEPWEGENGWLAFPNYRGALKDKHAVLEQYTFILAFENSDHFGYITEKAIDALLAGTIPLYWGGGGMLADLLSPDCLIDCRNADPDALHERLMAMPQEEIVAYRAAGLRFLRSPAAKRFTWRSFRERVVTRLEAQADAAEA